MTGRDLIIYILKNNLEDKPIYENGRILNFMSVEEAALKFGVGTATIELWFKLNMIKGFMLGETIYILANPDLETPYEQI